MKLFHRQRGQNVTASPKPACSTNGGTTPFSFKSERFAIPTWYFRTAPSASSRGQTIVEFALTFPLFAMMFFAIIYGGFLAADLVTLNSAARVAANDAAEHDGTLRSIAKYHVQNLTLFNSWYKLDANSPSSKIGKVYVYNYQKEDGTTTTREKILDPDADPTVDTEEDETYLSHTYVGKMVTVYIQAKRTTDNKLLAEFLPEAVTVKQSAIIGEDGTVVTDNQQQPDGEGGDLE